PRRAPAGGTPLPAARPVPVAGGAAAAGVLALLAAVLAPVLVRSHPPRAAVPSAVPARALSTPATAEASPAAGTLSVSLPDGVSRFLRVSLLRDGRFARTA